MNFKEFQKTFLDTPIKPFYLINSPNPFLRKQILSHFSDRLAETHSLIKFSISDTEVTNIINHFYQNPMFGNNFLISVTEVESIDKDDLKHIIRVFKDSTIATKNILILFINSKDKQSVKKLIDEAQKSGLYIVIDDFTESDIKSYIKNYFSKNQIAIEDGVEDIIFELIGKDIEAISIEIQKLSGFVNSKGSLAIDDVKKFIGYSKVENIFKFADNIIEGNVTLTFESLNNLLSLNTDVEQIINTTLNKVNTLLKIKSMLNEKGLSFPEINKTLNMNSYALKINIDKSKLFTFDRLYYILFELVKLQYKIRSGGLDKKTLLINFLQNYFGKLKK